MLFVVIASLLPMLLGYMSRDRFDRSFTTLALLFAVAFYCLPLLAAYSTGRVVYQDHASIFPNGEVARCIIGMFVFSSGFGGLCLYLKQRGIKFGVVPFQWSFRSSYGTMLLQVAFAAAMIIMVVVLYRSDFYATNVAVRAKEIKINYAFAASMMGLYFIGCYYLILALNRRSIILSAFWFVATLSLILIYGGRMQTLVVLALPFIRFFKRLNLALITMCIVIAVLFPLIIGGKVLIAAVGNHDDVVQAAINLYRNPISNQVILNNFAHPFVSYFYAPALVNEVGYRWFWDVPQGFLFYLRLFGINAGDSLTYLNTMLLIGVNESIIPPGYLAFGYVQANLFGVFLTGIFFRFTGSFARFIKERCLAPSAPSDFFFAFMAANTFYIGEMRGLVLTFFAPCFLMYVIGRRRLRSFSLGTRRPFSHSPSAHRAGII